MMIQCCVPRYYFILRGREIQKEEASILNLENKIPHIIIVKTSLDPMFKFKFNNALSC